ncbi:isopeptide-forming domain-containing fimbrial protein [Pseudogracilibacillus auburnensis]|nr:isopeptide-forming domain-containing fimbrial protein [Pseudogracilibacillus auburnensis]
MKKVRAFSVFAITLLILQIVSPNVGLIAETKSAKSDNSGKIEVKQLEQVDDSIKWKVTVNASGEETDGTHTKVTFSFGHTHGSINDLSHVDVEKTSEGYLIETPEGNDTYEIELMTKINSSDQTTFSLVAESNYGDRAFKASDQVEVQTETPQKETADEKTSEPVTETGTDEQQEKSKEEEKEKKAKETEEKEEKQTVNEEQDETEREAEEEEIIPLEQFSGGAIPKAKAFSANKLQMMMQVDEGTATHKIEKGTSDNICIREVEGTVNFNLPVPEEKKPVDIVVVQDASGSYSNNAGQVRQSLKDIVNMLDLTQDRMMVTSYRGYEGWRSYRNLSDYNNERVYDTRSGTNLILQNHTGLSNNANHLKNGIDQIRFDDATPTASGLQFAKNQYEAATAGEDLSDRKTIFILITDGVANIQLDGYIHLNRQIGTAWSEANQFYQPTFAQVVGEANSIKGLGYEMVSAYWENTAVLRNAYGTNYYNNTIGPAARQMLRDVASSPENYSANENLADLINEMLENLQSVVNEYNGFKTEFDIAPGFELVEDSIYLNGSQATYSVSGNTVTVTADKIKSGASILTYQLKETASHKDTTTPITNGMIYYDKENNSFNESIAIPNATLAGNEHSDQCEQKINKYVALGGSNDFTNSIELEKIHDSFTYKLEYQFGENISQYDTVQLKDELESVLELVGNVEDITVHSDNIDNLSVQISLLNNQSGFTVDLPKQNGSYNYLAGKKIVVTFQAKIKDIVTPDDLKKYVDQRIPNVATLLVDGEHEDSEEVYVKPPGSGTLKIIKIDADDQTKLAGAEFRLVDLEENIIAEGITDDNGEWFVEEIPIGKYKLIETKAPIYIDENGNEVAYRLLTSPIDVEIEHGGQVVELPVENTKQGWTIPKTGGFGTLGFYGIGLILMVAAVWYFIRRRQT